MSDRVEIPAGDLRIGESVRVYRPTRRGDLTPHLEGQLAAVNNTSVLVDVDATLHGTTVVLLLPSSAITHVWRQLPWGSAPSLLPVTHNTGSTDRSRRGWRGDRARRRRHGNNNPAARIGGHKPERGIA